MVENKKPQDNPKEATERKDLVVHTSKGDIILNNYYDNVLEFKKTTPFTYNKKQFWVWDKKDYKYKETSIEELLKLVGEHYDTKKYLVTGGVRNAHKNSLVDVGLDHKSKEVPDTWVQFKDQYYDINTQKINQVTPEYFFTNPIPHKLGESTETPYIDKLLGEWVAKDYIKSVLQFMAYCLTNSTQLETVFCLIAGGRNGKTSLLRLMTMLIGSNNVSTSDMDKITGDKNGTYALYKKKLCVVGETNFDVMTKTDKFKKIVSSDDLEFEKKYVDAFTDKNTCKICIATNTLPHSKDTSDGFYRRWVIIPFPNQFDKNIDILKPITETELENLCTRLLKLLPDLFKTGRFENQGTVEEKKQKFVSYSNPFPKFLKENFVFNEEYYVLLTGLRKTYLQYLKKKKLRKVSFRELKEVMEDEGLFYSKENKQAQDGQHYNRNWIEGLMPKEELEIKKNKLMKYFDGAINPIINPINLHDNTGIPAFQVMSILEELILEGKLKNIKTPK